MLIEPTSTKTRAERGEDPVENREGRGQLDQQKTGKEAIQPHLSQTK